MITRLERRFRTVIYHLLKDYPGLASITQVHRVWLAQRLLKANLPENVTFEDLTALVDRVFDVVITWHTSSHVTFKYEQIEISQDYADEMLNKVIESITLAYLNNDPWMTLGYTDERGLDPYLEFSIANPLGIDDSNAFVSTWQTDVAGTTASLSNQIKLPLQSGGNYDFVVDWGDGLSDTIVTHDQQQITHTYAAAGEYTIVIVGIIEGFGFTYATSDAKKLVDIQQWGTMKLHNRGYQFRGCKNLSRFSAVDMPNLYGMTNLTGMFAECRLFNDPSVGQWTMDSVVTVSNMFYNASAFNQPLNWQLPSLRKADLMFYNASAFNQDLTSWCVPQLTSEPTDFATGSQLTVQHKPIWGTCS